MGSIKANNGFTLIEVLIGATLMSFMLVILTGSLKISAESWDKGEAKMARASRMFVVENFIRSHVGSLLPLISTANDGQLSSSFQGRQNSMVYVAVLPEQVKAGGLFRYELYLAKRGETQDLRISIQSFSTGADRGQTASLLDDLPLVEDVKEFKLAYMGRQNSNNGSDVMAGGGQVATWMDNWMEIQPPALIRVDIVPNDEEPWPSLMIAPKTHMLR